MTSSTLWPEVSQFIPDSWVHKFGAICQEFRFDQRIPESLFSMVLDSPYPGMAVPDSFCGGGATLAECCRVQMILGFYNPGFAIGLNMHLFTLGVMTEHWKREKDISWMLLEGIAKKNSLVASAFAEPGLSGHILRSNTKARKVTGGYLLNGIKVPCSLASRSELLCLQAQVQGSDGPELIVGLLPTGSSVSPKSLLQLVMQQLAPESNNTSPSFVLPISMFPIVVLCTRCFILLFMQFMQLSTLLLFILLLTLLLVVERKLRLSSWMVRTKSV